MGSERADRAEYGAWNRKGATLSEVTAKKEYSVDRDFIVKGLRAGQLEYREGAVWGSLSAVVAEPTRAVPCRRTRRG